MRNDKGAEHRRVARVGGGRGHGGHRVCAEQALLPPLPGEAVESSPLVPLPVQGFLQELS